MKPTLAVLFSLMAGAANAQDLTEYQFKLSQAHANTVLNALAQLPYVQSAPVIAEIQKQAAEQLRAKAEDKKDKP